MKLGVAHGPFCLSLGDRMGAGCEGREQGLVRQDIDPASQSLGRGRNELDCSPIENLGTAVAGGAHAKVDVVLDVAAHQGLQTKAVSDALPQLPAGGRVGVLVEFRLPEEHDLQQLVTVRFEIRKQPDLLERFVGHRVRFVDQHYHPAALAEEPDEMLLKCPKNARSLSFFQFELELVADCTKAYVPRQVRIDTLKC